MKYTIAIILFTFHFSIIGKTQDYGVPSRPVPARLVNDKARILDQDQQQELERILTDYSNATSTQIVIYTDSTLYGFEKSQLAFAIIDKWGIGQKEKDNGLLILLVPKEKSENNKGEVFIATGRGLEGAIPDASAKRIIEEDMIPYFKSGDYFNGLLNGVNKCMELSGKDFPKQEAAAPTNMKWRSLFVLLLIVAFWIFITSRKVGGYARRNHLPWWTALWMMNSMGSHRGSWGNFHSGGGGFGGFGGGSSGGGGAGGSW